MKGRWGLAAFGAMMIGTAPVIAQTAPLQETADAVTSDLALCSAFYEAELTCLASTLDGGFINALQTGKSLADQYGVLLGKRAGLSGREVTARFERARASLGTIIGQSCDGLATIANQYATACSSLVQDPTRRFNSVAGGGAASGLLVQGR